MNDSNSNPPFVGLADPRRRDDRLRAERVQREQVAVASVPGQPTGRSMLIELDAQSVSVR